MERDRRCGLSALTRPTLAFFISVTALFIATALLAPDAAIASSRGGSPAPGAQPAVSLVSGNNSYCALLRGGGAECWGYNGSAGALGNGGNETQSNVPVAVKGLTDAVSLVSGTNSFCALLRGGGAECWGYNGSAGALGNGGNETQSNVPVAVKGLTDAVSLVSGTNSFCALLRGGGAKCWGYNGSAGALGNGGNETQSNVPVAVKGLTDAVSLVSGTNSFCALLRGGGAKCWGYNGSAGALGNGGNETQSNVPVAVKGLGK